MSFLASMPPARRRIWEAGLRAGIHDPEAQRHPRLVDLASAEAVDDTPPAHPEVGFKASMPADAALTILDKVATKHRLRLSDISGRCQEARIIAARQEAAYRLHVEADLTFAQIGERIGRSHTAAMHAAHGYAARYRLPSPVRGGGR